MADISRFMERTIRITGITGWTLWLLIAASFLDLVTAASEGFVNPTPRQVVTLGKETLSFQGDSPQTNHFKLLETDGDFLLVGARNHVFNLSIESLQLQHTIEWRPTKEETTMCRRKGKSEEDCHNYIRVLLKAPNATGGGDWTLVCGTNAFKPTCRQYEYDATRGEQRAVRQFDGYAVSPYAPRDNATAALVLAAAGVDGTDQSADGVGGGVEGADQSAAGVDVYSATVSDFSATDALVYRKRLLTSTLDEGGVNELRTRRNDVNVLNQPNFVGAFEWREHVYLWFRETAVEHVSASFSDAGMGRHLPRHHASSTATDASSAPVYARVARVCKRDRGGAGSYDGSWTTYVKARLSCRLNQTDSYVHFNELQAISGRPVGGDLVYAVFGTPTGVVQMSAVCAFRMRDVRRVFDAGAFKYQRQPDTVWSAYPEQLVRRSRDGVRPGMCTADSRRLSKEVEIFIRKHPLMDPSVPNAFDQPLLIAANVGAAHFTRIAVHSQVLGVDGVRHDVLFVGTDDGRVLKLFNSADKEGRRSAPVLVEELVVFGGGAQRQHSSSPAVINLRVVLPKGASTPTSRRPRLLVVSAAEVRSAPVAHCARQTSCTGCVRLQDPYCAWSMQAARCVDDGGAGEWDGVTFVQNLRTGVSDLCPEGDGQYIIDERPASPTTPTFPSTVSIPSPSSSNKSVASGLTLALIGTLVIGSTLGFIVGFLLARRYHRNRRNGNKRTTEDARTGKGSALSSTGSSGDDYYDDEDGGRSHLTRHAPEQNNIAFMQQQKEPAGALYGLAGQPTDDDRNTLDSHAHLLQQRLAAYAIVPPLPTVVETANNESNAVPVVLGDGRVLPYHSGTLKFERNVMKAAPMPYHNGTLPKNYKVKMVYV